jgi:hypothetical protein
MPSRSDIETAWDVIRCVHWVVRLARISILATLAGFLILLVPGQSQDIILAAGEDWGLGNFAAFTLAVLFWGFGAWIWARILVAVKRRRPEMLRLPDSERDRIIDNAITWVPRITTFAVFALVAAVFFKVGIADQLGPARDAAVILEVAAERPAPVYLLITYAAFLLALGLGVLWFLVRRRFLAAWLADHIDHPGVKRALRTDDAPGDLNKGNARTLRLKDLGGLTLTLLGFYVLTGLAVMVWFVVDPVSAGWSLGSANLIALAITQVIAVLSFTAFWTDRWHFPIFSVLIGAALVFSTWMDNHGLREIAPDTASAAPPARLDVAEALGHWKSAQKHRDDPMVIVATAGGGITAAYWTASVLGGLEDAHPGFHRHIFGISSVSGGSLGATVFRALLTHQQTHNRLPCPENTFQACARAMLSQDSLSPTLGSMLYPDLLQRFLPLAVFPDRAAALEKTWERAWAETALDPQADTTLFGGRFDDLWRVSPVPALFLNGTSVKAGRRIITSNLSTGNLATGNLTISSGGAPLQAFPDALDFHAITDIAIRTSTAANNSARFPVVGPPGSIPQPAPGSGIAEQIVDGGYFENFGATTGMDIATLARRVLPASTRIVFVQISSDATLPLTPDGDLAPPVPTDGLSWGAELRAPPNTLLETRNARGLQEVAQAQSVVSQEFDGSFIQFGLSQGCGNRAPLGWVLSNYARESLDQAWSRCAPDRVEALVKAVTPDRPLAANTP